VFGFETEFGIVSNIIGKSLTHPVFFCRCHWSTFDPLRGGQVVHGPAPRPPWRFTFHTRGDDIVVSGVEQGAGETGKS